jgi:hypothetical protein
MRNSAFLCAVGIVAAAWACGAKVNSTSGSQDAAVQDSSETAPRGDAATAMSSDAATAMSSDAATAMSSDAPATSADTGASADVSPGVESGPIEDAACAPPADGSCHSTCCTPAGTVEPITSAQAMYDAIAGRWLFCNVAALRAALSTVPADVVGVEFGPGVVADASCGVVGGPNCGGGNMYFLVQGPSGLARGAGFNYQWTYDVSTSSGSAPQFNIHPGPNSGTVLFLRYSPCPREFQVMFYPQGESVMVPAD